MNSRRLHRLLGIALVLPMLGWAATALVFYFKPGYSAAYAPLAVRALSDGEAPGALETRRLRTVLGEHLLVRTDGGWEQRTPGTERAEEAPAAPRPMPDEPALRRLIEDALAAGTPEEIARYGTVSSIERDGSTATAITTTGVVVTLDWDSLSLSQKGRDTDMIDLLYRIHYLQWTGRPAVDRVLGLGGISALFILTGLGVRLARG